MQQPIITIPPQLTTKVVSHPTPSMWIPQVQNPSNVPLQSTSRQVQPLLVDVIQPPTGEKYNLWIQPPITGGQLPNVTTPVETPSVNMG